MPKLFKFLNNKYVGEMLGRGVVAIGTAEDFRKADGKDAGRSDENELITKWTPRHGTHLIGPDHSLRKQFDCPPFPFEITFDQGVEWNFVANAYLYCMSIQATEEIKKRMARDFDADACIQINDPCAFYEAFKAHQFSSGRNLRGDQVSYVPSKQNEQMNDNDPFVKEEKFSWQKEFRFLWDGPVNEAKPILVIPQIVPLLSRLY